MSRFISAAVRRLSAASPPSFLLHGQTTRHPSFRQPPAPPPHPSTRHSFSPSRRHFHSPAAMRMINGSANPPAVPISLTSFFCCQLVLFSNLSKCFASGAKHIEDIVVILLQIKHLLQRRFSQQCMQVVFLMCATVVSLILPLTQEIINAAVQAFTDTTVIFCLKGLAAAALLARFLWPKLFRLRTVYGCQKPAIIECSGRPMFVK